MSTTAFLSHISETLTQIETDGLYKRERLITSPQAGAAALFLAALSLMAVALAPFVAAFALGTAED